MTSRGLRSPYGSDHSGRAGIFERQLIPVGSGITNSGLADVRGVPVDGAYGTPVAPSTGLVCWGASGVFINGS
jgi:hypothetical protein